jgi:hypothetical protein
LGATTVRCHGLLTQRGNWITFVSGLQPVRFCIVSLLRNNIQRCGKFSQRSLVYRHQPDELNSYVVTGTIAYLEGGGKCLWLQAASCKVQKTT